MSFSLDEDLAGALAPGDPPAVRLWEPPAVAVVLGRGNDEAREVRSEACRADGVPVLRRLGGGGAVVLGPGCLVVSVARAVARPLAVGDHLRAAVAALARALERGAGLPLEARGTGDLCLGDRKVLGSSAFARRGVFLYQASLLVDLDLGLVDRYLRHPSREPEYRRGRPHGEFLTTLAGAGWGWTPAALAARLASELPRALEEAR